MYEEVCETPQTWKLVWHYLHASDPFIQQILPLKSNNFLLTKTKYKHLVDMNFVKQRFDLVNSGLRRFYRKGPTHTIVEFAFRQMGVKLVQLRLVFEELHVLSCSRLVGE
jgi:hypothetical protein